MYPTYVLVALASRNSVFDRLFQNFVLSNAFFMVILSNFEFTIDFLQRNAAYTLYSFTPSYRSAIFNGGNGGPNLAIRQALRFRFRPGGTNSAGKLLRHDRSRTSDI